MFKVGKNTTTKMFNWLYSDYSDYIGYSGHNFLRKNFNQKIISIRVFWQCQKYSQVHKTQFALCRTEALWMLEILNDFHKVGVRDSSVVEPAPRDTQVLRDCRFESH